MSKIKDKTVIKKGTKQLSSLIKEYNDSLYKISLWQGNDDYGDLINLNEDPLEINNLWHDTNSKNLRFELLNKLLHEVLKLQSNLPKKQALT